MTAQQDKILFMKVGKHAGEDFESILERKREEFRQAGMTFWGYGGSTCHPVTQVRPFVRSIVERGGRVHLLMETMDSKAHPDVVPATEYSVDGVHWKALPSGIIVTGSRYALVLGEIKPEDFELPLHEYAVALGRSGGRLGSEYIQGRVDKACLEMSVKQESRKLKERAVRVSYSAEIVDPYAVLLRGKKPPE